MRFDFRRGFTMFVICLMLVTFSGLVSAQEETPEPAPDLPILVFPDPEGIDSTQIIATIGDETITLGDYATRMRYEYARYYRAFQSLVSVEGAGVFNLQDPTNMYARDIINVIDVMLDPDKFPAEVYRLMVLEVLYRQEAQARGITFTDCQLDTLWASTLQIQMTDECVFPDDFETRRVEYIALMTRTTGMSLEMMEQIVLGRTAVRNMQDVIADDWVVDEQPAVQTRHIRVRDEELAQTIADRLRAGEDFVTLLREYTVDSGAVGNRGELGFFRRGQTVPEFDAVLFNSPVGLLQQPVQTQFGYHVLEILELGELTEQVQLRQIVLATENEADIAVRLLNEGTPFSDLVERFSLDNISRRTAGLLNALDRQQVVAQFNQAVADAVFDVEEGTLLAPIETARGWHVFRVESKIATPTQVRSRHILVQTLDEALVVLERLNAGEDFGLLAEELSGDPSAKGANGDSLTLFSEGNASGLYIAGETREELDAVVFDAEIGDIIGPVQSRIGFYILEVQDKGVRTYSPQQIQQLRIKYVEDWEAEQQTSGRVVKTSLWRRFIPADLQPSDVYPDLVPLNLLLSDARENIRIFRESTNVVNTLRTLRLPER